MNLHLRILAATVVLTSLGGCFVTQPVVEKVVWTSMLDDSAISNVSDQLLLTPQGDPIGITVSYTFTLSAKAAQVMNGDNPEKIGHAEFDRYFSPWLLRASDRAMSTLRPMHLGTTLDGVRFPASDKLRLTAGPHRLVATLLPSHTSRHDGQYCSLANRILPDNPDYVASLQKAFLVHDEATLLVFRTRQGYSYRWGVFDYQFPAHPLQTKVSGQALKKTHDALPMCPAGVF